ncbi:MAG: general secretion pathway protein GspB [Xanthomonadales bacterium]|jgi:general secretion pathway protein B|nr:general secretion pathway protein GspB [Xanthomonadales bacterium]
MSILLDALKKSEEQRQLGRTPDIHAAGDHNPAGERKPAQLWLPLLLSIVAVAVMSWFGLKQYREPEMESVSGSPAVSERPAPQADGQPEQAGLGPTARTPVESFKAPAEQADPVESGPEGQDEQRRQELAQSFSQFRRPEPAGTAAESAATDTGAEAEAALQAPSPQPARQTAQPRPVAPHESAPISYWELPQNVRDSLPEFHITVMVYAEQPENRFLLINGQRMVEKDSVNGVVLEEIQRHGAIFRYRNYRFLVKG